MEHTEVKTQLKEIYDAQYSENTVLAEWRKLSAEEKADRIKSLTDGVHYDKVLEYGAGEGSIIQELDNYRSFSELFAVEISSSGKEKIEGRDLEKLKEVQLFDGYKTSYPDDYFDLVYCSHVIEHVEFPRLVLREIKRISKNQIFEIPLDYKKGVDRNLNHFLEYGHINIYTPSLFKFLLKSEGFEIVDELYTNTKQDIIRYSWYNNRGIKKTFYSELKIKGFHLYLRVKSIFLGQSTFNEYHRNAYTCRTKKLENSLHIF